MQKKSFIETLKTPGYQREAFTKYKDAICDVNQVTLEYLLRYGSYAYALLALASFFVEPIAESFAVYVVTFIALAVLSMVSKIFKRKTEKTCYVLPMLYLTTAVLLFACISITAQYHTKTEAVSYIASLVIFPPLILDKFSHVTVFTALMNIVFIVYVSITKIDSVAVLDIINSSMFMIISICLSAHNVNTKLARIVSNAQLEWNDSLYRHILTSSNDIIFDFNLTENNSSISENSHEYFYLDVNNPVSFIRNIHPEDRAKFKGMLRDWKNNQHEDLRILTKCEVYKWFSFSTIAIKDASGNYHHIIGRITDIDVQKRKEETLKLKSEKDALTGTYNKITTELLIHDNLETEAYKSCALLIADIDNLKGINDTLGHIQGDRAIKAFADVLTKAFPQGTLIGRVGGDEFMVLLSEDQIQNNFDAALISLTKSFSSIFIGEDDEYRISGSIGVALRTPNLEEFKELYKMADSALYHVKNDGKNGFAFYQEYHNQ